MQCADAEMAAAIQAMSEWSAKAWRGSSVAQQRVVSLRPSGGSRCQHASDVAIRCGYSHYEYSVDAGVTWCGPWPAAAMVAYLRAGQLSGDGVRVRPAELRAVDEWRRQRAAAASSGGAAEPKADG